jgi:hypothetical protein
MHMLSWLVRLFLIVVGVMTEWFVSEDSPNFDLVRAVMGILLIALIVGVLALWPRRWSEVINRIGRGGEGGRT